jgi:hypothetical protein
MAERSIPSAGFGGGVGIAGLSCARSVRKEEKVRKKKRVATHRELRNLLR